MPEKKETLFSKSVRAGSKTYFIDVRETAKGSRYLTICESKRVEGQYERSSIAVFSEHIPNFFQALKEAAPALKG